ncbi:MAG: hypothetical protein ACRYHQ_34430 [Janthinobacterium lividum]
MTLEQFIEEGIKLGIKHGFQPTVFVRMRQDYGLVGAIERLVKTGEPQAGFRRMKEFGLVDWTLEAAVLKYPDRFSKHAKEFAKARLDGILDA